MNALLALGMLIVVFMAYVRAGTGLKSAFALCLVVPYVVSVALLVQLDTGDARMALRDYVDSSLGQPVAEKVYDENCWSLVAMWEALDLFVVAHTVGWIFSTLTVRSWRMAFLMGLVDELVEIAFACRHPNFAECWWDHGLDLVCNLAGALLGGLLCRKCNMRPYKWFDGAAGSLEKQLSIAHIITARITVFLCIFGSKYVLWIPDSHWLNIVQPFTHIILVERITAEHHTPPSEGGSRLRWWLLLGWLGWLTNIGLITKHGYFGPCIFEGPLRMTVMSCGVIASVSSLVLLVLMRLWPGKAIQAAEAAKPGSSRTLQGAGGASPSGEEAAARRRPGAEATGVRKRAGGAPADGDVDDEAEARPETPPSRTLRRSTMAQRR